MDLERISILTGGSRGDIQPYIAAGVSLKNAGYTVRIITNCNHDKFVSNFGLDHVSMYADFEKVAKEDEVLLNSSSNGDTKGFFAAFLKITNDYAKSDCEAFHAEMTGPHKPDLLLVSSYPRFFGEYASRIWNIPVIYTFLQMISHGPNKAPWNLPLLPTKEQRDELLQSTVGGQYGIWNSLNDHMKRLNPLLPSLYDVYTKDQMIADYFHPRLPRIVCQPRLYRSILYPETTDNVHFIGPCTISAREQIHHIDKFGGDHVNQQIEQFLNKEENTENDHNRPVYLGWGSMIFLSPEKMVEFAVRALYRTGRRGIILSGWADLSLDLLRSALATKTTSTSTATATTTTTAHDDDNDDDLLTYAKENILFVREASHENLFPRMACIVHHGGAGTTVAALRSGVPSIITPVFMDQFDHAHLINELGVGIGFSTQLQKMTPEILGDAIRTIINDDDDSGMMMRKRAKDVRDKILEEEDGAQTLVMEVDEFWKKYVKTGIFSQIIKEGREEKEKVEEEK